ncbi:MAG: HD domain-containing response regulator [Eubacteriales bacterium]|nr:HD domain-containing response regulator [Eubacteriales bacterium]
MRRKRVDLSSKYRIMVVDDEEGIIDSLSVILNRSGYGCAGFTDPVEALGILREEHYDLLILDYLMNPIHGDKVVESIREFDKDIYILLLTGHKDIAPPLETIKALDIQGYCEKSDKFEQLLLLIESGIKSVAQMRTIKSFKDGLGRIIDSVPRIYHLNDFNTALMNVLGEMNRIIGRENSFILAEINTENDSCGGNSSGQTEVKKTIFKGTGEFAAGEIPEEKDYRMLLDRELLAGIEEARIFGRPLKMAGGMLLPLKDRFSGFIGSIYTECDTNEETERLLEIFAEQVAAAVSNICLHDLVRRKNDEIERTYDQLKKSYIDTIEALRQAVGAKDVYTRGHSDRVSYYSARIGEAMGLNGDQVETLRISGIFHDIGKISISDNILLKPSALEEEEFEEMRKHPLRSAQILAASSLFREVVPVVRSHHERIDGKGYPDNLKGDGIPLMARILAVSDAFDAMTSDRSYRPKMSLEESVKQLKGNKGTQFDGEVVETFIKLLDKYEEMEAEIRDSFGADNGKDA